MSQTPGIYKSPDVFSRSKGEVHASDADESEPGSDDDGGEKRRVRSRSTELARAAARAADASATYGCVAGSGATSAVVAIMWFAVHKMWPRRSTKETARPIM